MLFLDILLLSYFIVIVHAIKFRGVLTAWQNDCLFKKKKTQAHQKTAKQRCYRKVEKRYIVVKSGRSSQFKNPYESMQGSVFHSKIIGKLFKLQVLILTSWGREWKIMPTVSVFKWRRIILVKIVLTSCSWLYVSSNGKDTATWIL